MKPKRFTDEQIIGVLKGEPLTPPLSEDNGERGWRKYRRHLSASRHKLMFFPH